MKTIKQKNLNDCGVACVAMLARVDYQDAFDAIHPTGRSKLTHTKDLHVALERLGRKPLTKTRIGFRSKAPDDLNNDALIFVKMGKKGKRGGHWIVWDAKAKKLRDPDRPEKPYLIKGYLEVE